MTYIFSMFAVFVFCKKKKVKKEKKKRRKKRVHEKSNICKIEYINILLVAKIKI